MLCLLAPGVNADSLLPAGDFPGSAVGLGYLSSQGPISVAASPSPAVSLIAGSSYPEAYRWTGISVAAKLGRPNGPASGVIVERKIVVGLADAPDAQDDEFRWTRGAGIIGLGFVWRFR